MGIPEKHPLRKPAALLFDMDGTLTRPMLDFDAIRAEIGIRGPILEAIRHCPPAELDRANAILDRHERIASEESVLNEGCRELIDDVDALRLPRALVTRNSRASVDIVLRKHGLVFDVVVSREDHPPKPHPDALRNACRRLGVDSSKSWMIGDGSHDIEAGVAAGMTAVWVSHGKARAFGVVPTVSVLDLNEVRKLLNECAVESDGSLSTYSGRERG